MLPTSPAHSRLPVGMLLISSAGKGCHRNYSIPHASLIFSHSRSSRLRVDELYQSIRAGLVQKGPQHFTMLTELIV